MAQGTGSERISAQALRRDAFRAGGLRGRLAEAVPDEIGTGDSVVLRLCRSDTIFLWP